MARQCLGLKKINRLRIKTGLDIVNVFVRGNTNHRKDLCIIDGYIYYLYKNGEIIKTNNQWKILI